MKRKTKELLNLIAKKKKEIRQQKFEKAIHEHTMKRRRNSCPLTEEEEREFNRMVREGLHLLQIDKRADEKLNKDVAKVHKQLFGY
jgi:hypothetical protein